MASLKGKKQVFLKKILSIIFLFSLSVQSALAATTLKTTANDGDTASGLTNFFATIFGQAPSWIAALVVFALSFFVAGMVKEKVVDKFSEKFTDEDQDVLVLIGRTTYAISLALGITIALKIAGIDVTAIVAAIGFGLGFAMQDLMTNFIAGILILMNRQFVIGDFIKVGSTLGKVVEIQSRATILKAIDGTRVIVPNSALFKNQVTSFTSNPFRRIEITGVGVDYYTDLAYTQKVIYAAILGHSHVLREPKPVVLVDTFGDSSIDFKIRFWVESRANWMQIKSEVITAIKRHLDEAGIDMPYPIYSLEMGKEMANSVIPTYRMSSEELVQFRKKRQSQEEALAQQIAASAKEEATQAETQKLIQENHSITMPPGMPQGANPQISSSPTEIQQPQIQPQPQSQPLTEDQNNLAAAAVPIQSTTTPQSQLEVGNPILPATTLVSNQVPENTPSVASETIPTAG
ncbi:MAG: mechanosensitive ion channel MscS [Candidatus Peregrinibacteria bacterium GW2011_GWE2_39_6]|nr:MAG: mechanosensitive ion channel MscS [Candidatus Peregrinibacteria bacterium GW2011_GWF2_39_17]KKR25134.1 MAG: mechanosensitive ion channel MscS [Candidatus Peregrinibacteria bacterium GW2011_GWE2_39_6]HCW31957.1 hypothetical protein [Candidatus Peregrinibacteria bacterium]